MIDVGEMTMAEIPDQELVNSLTLAAATILAEF
jgi:hypothetical protein